MEVIKELYQKYENFDVYKTYFVKKDSQGNIIEKKPRWNETVAKKKKFKAKSLAQQILDAMSERE